MRWPPPRSRKQELQDEGRRTSTHVHAADALIRIERIGSSEYNCLLDARKPRFEAMDAGIAHYPSTDQTRPNFCTVSLTKARHAASVPTSACVKATLAPAVSSSAATRWPRSPSRSQNATLAPSATKRLTVASPIPDAPPVTAATLPSSLPMFATFHWIAKRASTIRRIYPAGIALSARSGCPTLTGCGSFKRPLSGPFDGLTRSDLGRIEPLQLAWSCDRLRRNSVDRLRETNDSFPRAP